MSKVEDTRFLPEWRWPHFKPVEVLSPKGLLELDRGCLLLQPSALDLLENFRQAIDTPLICNFGNNYLRGYRSIVENSQCGGSLLSRHIQGIAFDVHSTVMTLDELADAARAYGWTGIGVYYVRHFVHLDCRTLLGNTIPVTWNG